MTGRRDSENGFSKVSWCLTLHEERPKAVSMLIAHVGCGSGELENSFVWQVDIIPGRHLPSFPSVSLKQVEKYDSGANT